jgi:hypothetical protein
VLGDLSEQTLLVINRCSSTSGSEHNNLIKYDTPFISKQVEFLELGTINNGVSNISCLIFDQLQVSFFPFPIATHPSIKWSYVFLGNSFEGK